MEGSVNTATGGLFRCTETRRMMLTRIMESISSSMERRKPPTRPKPGATDATSANGDSAAADSGCTCRRRPSSGCCCACCRGAWRARPGCAPPPCCCACCCCTGTCRKEGEVSVQGAEAAEGSGGEQHRHERFSQVHASCAGNRCKEAVIGAIYNACLCALDYCLKVSWKVQGRFPCLRRAAHDMSGAHSQHAWHLRSAPSEASRMLACFIERRILVEYRRRLQARLPTHLSVVIGVILLRCSCLDGASGNTQWAQWARERQRMRARSHSGREPHRLAHQVRCQHRCECELQLQRVVVYR